MFLQELLDVHGSSGMGRLDGGKQHRRALNVVLNTCGMFLGIMLLSYALLTQVVKTWFIRKFGE